MPNHWPELTEPANRAVLHNDAPPRVARTGQSLHLCNRLPGTGGLLSLVPELRD